MNRSDRNPLRTGPGKGDSPKNCHNPKFRKNYDEINWAFNNVKGKQLTLKKLKELINKAGFKNRKKK